MTIVLYTINKCTTLQLTQCVQIPKKIINSNKTKDNVATQLKINILINPPLTRGTCKQGASENTCRYTTYVLKISHRQGTSLVV